MSAPIYSSDYPQLHTASIEQLQFTGRWNLDESTEPWTAWQGSSVSVRVIGKAVAFFVEVGDNAERVRILINGVPEGPARSLKAGRKQWVNVSLVGRDDEPHTVTLVKETDAAGRLSLRYVAVDQEGEILPPAPMLEKRIAFFGDSNPEGYSLYGEKDHGPIGTYYAYPAMVSRMLGAEAQIVVRGSAQLDSDGPNDVMSFIYSAEFDNEDSEYRDEFDPDVIVVNAGANDIFNVPEAERKTILKARYHKVVNELRKVYGDEPHILLVNAFGWDLDEPANYSHEVVDEIGGNLSTHFFPWCWEQWHGDMIDHAGQAEHLAKTIVDLGLGFKIQRPVDVVSGYSGTFDVINGSFEHIARDGYGGFGWRYFEDGVERVHDVNGAADGEYFIALEKDELVHQCVDATGDLKPGGTVGEQQYTLTAMMRSDDEGAIATLGADYEAQAMYNRQNPESETFEVTNEWQFYSTVLTAPEGTWKTFAVLASKEGTVEFDKVKLGAIDPPMRRHAMQHDGAEREYFVHVPPGRATDESLPVVVAVHGYTSTATGFQAAHALNRHANENGYAVIYVQGSHFLADTPEGSSWRVTTWNDVASSLPVPPEGPHCADHAVQYPCPPECNGSCKRCDWASCYDDLGFFDRLIAAAIDEYGFDEDRVYALGVSAGAQMTLRLGCSRSDTFAAVAPIIGQLARGHGCAPDTNLPMFHLYGGKDEVIRPDGTAGLEDAYFYVSAADTASIWAEGLSCEAGPEPYVTETTAAAGLQCTAYSSCAVDGQPVVSCGDPNEAHAWPSQGYDGMPATCITPEQQISMPDTPLCPEPSSAYEHYGMDVLWEFFRQYERDGATP
ncbi:MAG: SGNH/GDSL hydrolase family protein [Pseudomonadota bacterium]